jgi:two-component system C4-dicarboxylate transport response regulator DctD
MMAPEEDGRFGMVGRSRLMQDVYQQIEIAARADVPVLIVGETGVGKELAARAIHAQSARSSGPFVPVNAGGLPETMLESELFGHARGAFTGADVERDGKLVTASGGVLLLDEIESISERAQMQLLRVLEDGLVQPLGKDIPRPVDIRLLATTKVDLAEHVRLGQMREDFYHRIVVLTIAVPPLREHPDDIPLLVSYFLRSAAHRHGIGIPEVAEKDLDEMLHHTWPGNVRELKNAVERMVITAHHGVTGPFVLDESFAGARLLSLPATGGRLREEMERIERSVIEAALREHRGEINATCRALGISRRALYERMKKYALQKESYR